MSIKLNLYAPHIFISWAGFARVGRMIALGLEDLGVQVNLVNITPSKYDGLITKEEYSRLCSMARHSNSPDIWLSLAPGCAFLNRSKGWNIGMSMWETYTLPSFGQNCRNMDEIWVPSLFNWEVFKASGHVTEDHMSLIPLGVDTNVFTSGPRSISITDSSRTPFDFIYGTVCTYSDRKGLDIILTAHFELFDAQDRVTLFIKGDPHGGRLLPRDLMSLQTGNLLLDFSDKPKDFIDTIRTKCRDHKPTVLYNFDWMGDTELRSLYKALDLFVFPSRGEGFGLPPLEAMSCEVPVIGTKATGMAEYMQEEVSYPVRSREPRVWSGCDHITNNYVGHLFADPDYEQYRDLVYHVYTNREEAKEKAKRARELVVKNYSYPIILGRIKSRLEEVMEGKHTTENFLE